MRGNQRLNHDDMNVVHLHFYSICNERGWKTPVNPTEFDWVYLDVDNHIVQARIETPARVGVVSFICTLPLSVGKTHTF